MLVTASIFLLHYHEESLKQTIFKGVDGQAMTAVHGIEFFIHEGSEDAHAISLSFPLQAFLQGDLGEVESYLKKMFKAHPKFGNGLFLLDRKGKFLADYPPHQELRGQSFSFREYYQRTMHERRGIVGRPYRSKRTGLPVLTFTEPVRDARGRIIAIVACSANLLSREALGGYRKQKFGKTGYLYIFDRSRLLVLHPEDNRLLTSVEKGKNKIMEDALKGFEGGGETVNSQGVPMLLAVRQVPNIEWIVAVQVTQEEAYAPVAEARKRIFFGSSIAILLAIIFGAVAIRRVTMPLQQLERVASQIGADLENSEFKGDYNLAESSVDVLKTIRSRDEIGMLASSFLRLTTKLRLTLGSLQHSVEDWQRTFNSVNEAVITLDLDGRIVKMNQTAKDWFRTSSEKSEGRQAFHELFGTETPPKDWPTISSLAKHQRVGWSQGLEKPRGTFEFTITPITLSGATTGAVLVISDITERMASEKYIRELAFYDPLTNLPNRLLLQDRIHQAFVSSGRSGKKTGLMFLDLDNFKEINDLYGHDVGDEMLKQIADSVSGCIRNNDTLSRIGGDEFVVLLQDVDDPQNQATTIAKRIIAALSSPLSIKGHEVKTSISIGIAFFPDDGGDSETVLKHADTAMYWAKSSGHNNYRFFH